MLVESDGRRDKQTVVKVTLRYSNRGKETMIDVDNMNTTYQDLITAFPSNTILYYVGILWIFENNEQLKNDMDIQFEDWMTGGT